MSGPQGRVLSASSTPPPPQMFLFESRITATTTVNFSISNKDQVPKSLIPCAQFVVVFLVMRFVSRLDELLQTRFQSYFLFSSVSKPAVYGYRRLTGTPKFWLVGS